MKDRTLELAEGVRLACVRAAEDAYEDAGIRGLCAEGRWECALEAIRSVALGPLVRGIEMESGKEPRAGDD